MGSKVLDISNFDYERFEPVITPSARRLSNYNSMPARCAIDATGYVQNPFPLRRKKSNRFVCFEALRRGISLEQIVEEMHLDLSDTELLRRTYDQVKLCYFSHILK